MEKLLFLEQQAKGQYFSASCPGYKKDDFSVSNRLHRNHFNWNRFGRNWLGWLLFLAVSFGLFLLLQRLVMPKYQSSLLEGALIREYYASPKTHDILFFGDCEVYESFSPTVLEEESGLSSFIRGSASQRIWQSYYLMEETLTYETPKLFVFNVLAMQYGDPVREEYNRMTLDGMRWSGSKLRSVLASRNPEESLISYLFPLLRYHDRWSELTAEDVTCLFHTRPVSEQGYLPQEGVKPAGQIPEGKPLADYQFPERCYSYLDQMRMLCEKEGITLILVKAPSLYPYWYPEWEEQIEDYAERYDLPYFNFLEAIPEIGLDFQTDTYDAGLHLNRTGAEKLTRYFARCLKELQDSISYP